MNKFFKIASVLMVIPLALGLAACDEAGKPSAQQIEQRAAQAQQSAFNVSSPIPKLPISQERENLVKRATRINVQNMTGCANVFSDSGVLVASYVVAGKISSLNSYLLSSEQIINDPHGTMDAGSLVMEQPDIDGAYGQNADGVFFFTADTDAYTEVIGGMLIYSDECRTVTSSPLLVQNTNEQ